MGGLLSLPGRATCPSTLNPTPGTPMYSPAIAPGLIPVLYRLGKARGVPMTRLVSELLFDALERIDLPANALPHFHLVVPDYRNPAPLKEAA